MSDGLSDGARATRQHKAFTAYLIALTDCIEVPKALIRRQRALEAARVLDHEYRVPRGQGQAAKLGDLLVRLQDGDKVQWGRLLLAADEQIPDCPTEIYDRLVAMSPFKGKVLAFVSDWNGGSKTSLDGEITRRLADAVRKRRKGDDHYRERFIVAIDMPEIADEDIVRIPSHGETTDD